MNTENMVNNDVVEIGYPQSIPIEFLPTGFGSDSEYLLYLCKSGAKQLYGCEDLDNPPSLHEQSLHERLYYEIAILNRHKLIPGMIFMRMIVDWMKDRRIFSGLGQGALPGSLVAYLIGISAVDPLSHGLLFERFFNPERVTLLNFTIDVNPCRKEEVLVRARTLGAELCALEESSVTTARDDSKQLLLIQVQEDALIDQISITRSLVELRHGLSVDHSHIDWDDIAALKLTITESDFVWKGTDIERALKEPGIMSIGLLTAGKAISCIGDRELRQKYTGLMTGEVLPSYDHPLMEPVLNETFGLIIYEEQIMLAARSLAGFSLGQGDILRRALIKNKAEVMALFREKFVDGCFETNAICREIAEPIFDNLVNCASRLVSKVDAVGMVYKLYLDTWLKVHYAQEHNAASLAWLSMNS